MKIFYFLILALVLVACATDYDPNRERFVGKAELNYNMVKRIKCLSYAPMGDSLYMDFRVGIKQYTRHTDICYGWKDKGDERCIYASVPYDDHGVVDVFKTREGDTLKVGSNFLVLVEAGGCLLFKLKK